MSICSSAPVTCCHARRRFVCSISRETDLYDPKVDQILAIEINENFGISSVTWDGRLKSVDVERYDQENSLLF